MLVGWDAADWKIIHQLIDADLMPTTKNLIENGVMGNMRTLSPVLSPMLWTSIATGKRPFKHGIYGFTEPTPDGKAVQPMTNVSRKCKAVWNILNQNDMKSIVVGWWPSHPAEPIDGVMISDYFHKAPKKPGDQWSLIPKCIHPSRLQDEIEELRVHPLEITAEHILPFVPDAAEVNQESDSRLSMVMKIIAECSTIHASATHLLESEPWDFAAIYYDAIDHFCHGFMKYHPPQRGKISDWEFKVFQNVVRTGYIYHDMMLKRLLELAGKDTTVILMSDHGFHPDHLRPKMLPSEPAGPAIEHRDYGIFVVSGPNIKKDGIIHGANLLDVAPTILSIYGLPVGEDMDGRALVDIFEEQPDIASIPSWEEVEGNAGQHPTGMVIDPAESKEALEQLIALGYIERPDANAGKAVAQATRELNYNLARSYMDAGMHGEATPLLLQLYQDHPLEFRFGIQLANCLRAMNRNQDLERLVNDLNGRWRIASEEAKKRIGDVAKVAKTRKEQWQEMKVIDEQHKDDDVRPPRLARVNAAGKPLLFNDVENHSIRKLRSIARGNPQTLDFLSATIAISKGDFEQALEYLDKAGLTKSENPGFLFHVGNVYLGLQRFQDAEQSFSKALQIDESHSNSLMGMCRTYLELGQYSKAIDFGTQAVGLNFQFPVAHYFLGLAKLRVDDPNGAIESLQTAVQQNPNFQEAHEHLARIYSTAHLDEQRSKFHAATARSLATENVDVVENNDPIELPQFDNDDFRLHLPEIPGEGDNSKEFLKCLAQPKGVSPLDNDAAAADQQPIVIVSGLPRSGTSMMMQMLVAGGLQPYTDERREADENNPNGYYEAEDAKQLAQRNLWLGACQGKVVKIVAPLIPYLPQKYRYKVVFMDRDLTEIVGSQNKMLERLEKSGGDLEDERLQTIFSQQAQFATNLLAFHDHPLVKIGYHDAISNPEMVAQTLAKFLNQSFDVRAAAGVVDPALYRQREP